MVLSSASTKFCLGSSPKDPSVVTTIPTTECSFMTFSVPISAASAKGIFSSCHGVDTIRSLPSSLSPRTPGTIYPTQSTSLTLRLAPLCVDTRTESGGMNLGSVVVIVLPSPLCGNSSVTRVFSYRSDMAGRTIISINRLINVDFPVLTGPTTPT